MDLPDVYKRQKEYLLSLFMAFGESLWDGVDNYSIEKVNPNTFDYYDPATNLSLIHI